MKNTLISLFSLLLIAVLLSACGGAPQEKAADTQEALSDEELIRQDLERDALLAQVMEIHDEVMPKMEDIMRLKSKLKDREDADEILDALDAADKAMMNWMRNFKAPSKDLTFDQAMEYLEAQRKSIADVRDLMLEAIANAEIALEN
jgi:hypothetical protein